MKYFLLILLFFNINTECSKVLYPLTNDPIDVVMTCHEKDLKTVDLSIEGIKKCGKNIRRVIVVSEKKLTENAEWFDESKFPFSKYDIALAIYNDNEKKAYNYSKLPRCGWISKQLMNFYAAFVIPGISPNILILDSDTIFLNDVEFIDAHGFTLFNVSNQYHEAYFEHAKKLISGENQIKKVYPEYSGITHHMLFQKPILEDLFKLISETHKMEPWKAICKCIKNDPIPGSPMAETEIYFNFALARTNQVKIRRLKWQDLKFNLHAIFQRQKDGYHYVSCHHYLAIKK